MAGCGELNFSPAPHLETRNSMSCSVNSPALGLAGSIEDGGDRGWAVSKAPPGQVSGRVPLLGKDSIKDFPFVCLQVCTHLADQCSAQLFVSISGWSIVFNNS